MAAAAAAPTPVLVLPPSDICKPATCVSSEASAALQQALTQTTAHLRHALIAACIYFNPLTPAFCILQQWRCAIASEPLSLSLVSRAHVGCFCPYPPSYYLSPSFPHSSHTNSLLRPPPQRLSWLAGLQATCSARASPNAHTRNPGAACGAAMPRRLRCRCLATTWLPTTAGGVTCDTYV